MWQHTGLPTREAHLSLGVQSLYSGSITVAWLTAHMADFSFWPLRKLSWYCLTQSPILNHTVNYLAWPKVPRQTKTLLSAMTLQELRDYLTKVKGKKPDLFWGKFKFFTTLNLTLLSLCAVITLNSPYIFLYLTNLNCHIMILIKM